MQRLLSNVARNLALAVHPDSKMLTRNFAALLAAAGIFVASAAAAEGGLAVELNKLEARDGACRAYLVFENRTGAAFEALELDIILFGTDGVIAKRLAVDASPLAKAKTSVKLFDIDGLACKDIGRILLNDTLACTGPEGERDGCVEAMTVSSRGETPPFTK